MMHPSSLSATNSHTDPTLQDSAAAENPLPSLSPSSSRSPHRSTDPSLQASPLVAQPLLTSVTRTLWQEWRNTDDEEYARHLFNLLGDTPLDNDAQRINISVGAIYGALTGGLVGLLAITSQLSPAFVIGPLCVGLGALIGAGMAWIQNRLNPELTCKEWLARLTFHLSPQEMGVMAVVIKLTFIINMLGSVVLNYIAWLESTIILLLMFLGLKLLGWMLSQSRPANPAYLTQYRPLWFWWPDRPSRLEVEKALRQMRLNTTDTTWDRLLAKLEQRKQNPAPVSDMITGLQSQDWQDRFVAAHLLVVSGGEAVAELHALATKITSPLHKKAFRLLQGIAQETSDRLANPDQTWLCPHCLTRSGAHKVLVDYIWITYYGCRSCCQSREFLAGDIVAVLDADSQTKVQQQEDSEIHINWLVERALFDFDRVEIVQATDEDVERFAVQVGNDTDPARTAHYQHMLCVVQPSCRLSANSRRILSRVFGEVRDA